MDHLPWTEKYRPSRLEEVCSQQRAVAAMRGALRSGHFMHLLLYGPPGTGKTSAVGALARELYGDEVRRRVLELNASDERGVAAIRTKVKAFAQQAVGRGEYKLVVLDEADALTPEAQQALRRIMEDSSDVTRFCLMCNYVTRIIPPVSSRCAKFHFRRVPRALVVDRLRHIAQAEKLVVDSQTLESVAHHSNGDLRRAITLLQTLRGYLSPSPSVVAELVGCMPPEQLEHLQATISATKPSAARRVLDACELAENLLNQGFSALSIVRQLGVENPQLSTSRIKLLADAEYRIASGADELLQLTVMQVSSVPRRPAVEEPRQSWLRALALIASKNFNNPLNKQLWCKLAPLDTDMLAVQILWSSPPGIGLKYAELAAELKEFMGEWQAGKSQKMQMKLDEIADLLETSPVPSYTV